VRHHRISGEFLADLKELEDLEASYSEINITDHANAEEAYLIAKNHPIYDQHMEIHLKRRLCQSRVTRSNNNSEKIDVRLARKYLQKARRLFVGEPSPEWLMQLERNVQ
jgi:hypothetical protein